MGSKCYVAGPMRGYPNYNRDAFAHAAALLRSRGISVFDPGELDPAQKIPEPDLTESLLHDIFRVDTKALLEADWAVFLQGWEDSKGASYEELICRMCGIPTFTLDGHRLIRRPETVLEEAERLTSGDRNSQYGDPTADLGKTAQLWEAAFGWKTSPRKVSLAMVLLKLSRESHKHKRDNIVDACGYLRLVERIVNDASR